MESAAQRRVTHVAAAWRTVRKQSSIGFPAGFWAIKKPVKVIPHRRGINRPHLFGRSRQIDLPVGRYLPDGMVSPGLTICTTS